MPTANCAATHVAKSRIYAIQACSSIQQPNPYLLRLFPITHYVEGWAYTRKRGASAERASDAGYRTRASGVQECDILAQSRSGSWHWHKIAMSQQGLSHL